MKKNETKLVEKEKIVAEKLNGRFAMMGFVALVGAYLTTGQIIPGFIQVFSNRFYKPDCQIQSGFFFAFYSINYLNYILFKLSK